MQEIEIPVPWGHVSGKWWGPRSREPILALHGWQDNAGTWDNLIPLLSPKLAVLCLDLPGHGFSTHYPPGMQYYLFWDGVPLIRRIVKYFGWSKISLLGHSMGGALIFTYAAAFPNEVDRIILIDIASPAVREPRIMVESTGSDIDKILVYEKLTEDQVPCYDYDTMIDLVYEAYKGALSRENCKVMMRRGMSPAQNHTKKGGYYFNRDLRLKASGLAIMSIETALVYAGKIKCKVLNLRAIPGQRWERLDYYMNVIKKLKETTQVEYHEVEGSHHVHLENPERVVKYLAPFIQDLV